MKRILVMGMSNNRGGMETCIMNYYRHIDKSKIQFDFISYNQEPYCADEIEEMGGRCFVITGRSVDYKKNKEELKALFAEHGHEFYGLWYNCCMISDLSLFKLAKEHGIEKRVIHSHASRPMGNFVTNNLHHLFKKRIAKYATDFWACSVSAAHFFYTGSIMNSPKFNIVTNAVNVENYFFNAETRNRIREEYQFGSDLVLGTVGRMTEEKNQMFLLEIFAEVHKVHPASTLIMAGSGELEQLLKEKAATLGVYDNVRFLGQIANVSDFYNAMDIFLLPSKHEGLPMTLVEAQVSGLPCFTSTEAVTLEAQITPLLQFQSLQDSPKVWAEAIYERYKRDITADRWAYRDKLTDSSWNIKKATAEMERLFEE